MKKLYLGICKFFTVLLFLKFASNLYAQNTSIKLENWEISKAYRNKWFPVKIPCSVQPAMFQNNRISDPFKGDIEENFEFIAQNDWTYRTTLHISAEQFKAKSIKINFEGIETYSDIYINGRKIGSSDNMFRSFEYELKPELKVGDNSIEVYCLAPLTFTKKINDSLGIVFPGGQRAWTRQAQFQFGWDFAPTYIAMGLWKPVTVSIQSAAFLKSINTSYQVKSNTVEVDMLGEIFAYSDGKYFAEATLDGQTQGRNIVLHPGENKFNLHFTIKNPALWWPNGSGKQNLYNLSFKGGQKTGQKDALYDSFSRDIGFRTVELVTDKDKQGESFYFKINGKPIYAKGANYVPADVFPEQVSYSKIKQLLGDAQESGFNMLRVWGGGIYESEEFYHQCDSLGIMVWQDFMFAGSMYPNEPDFMDNVKNEAEENVKRISNHPCISLWCGNNEISEGWQRWGWKDAYPGNKKAYLEEGYDKLFLEILPQSVQKYGQNVPYWESSPKFGRGDIRHRFEGDSHYWGVWHDEEDFSSYEEKVPRFMSEFGFQSYPELSTIRFFTGHELTTEEKSMRAHQKSMKGNNIIKKYIARDFPEPKDFESFVYLSQVEQAEGVGRGIMAQRMAMPYCMGSLYWQFNDCWPAISWSSIDYFGRWKALQYKAKSLYEPIVVGSRFTGDKMAVSIVSEKDEDAEMSIKIRMFSLDGLKLDSSITKTIIKSNSAAVYIEKDFNTQIKKYGSDNLCFVTEIIDKKGIVVSQHFQFLEKPKMLKLQKDAMTFKVREIKEGYAITIHSDAINPGIWITSDMKGRFSENYFNMTPGTKEIIFYTTESAKVLSKAFTIKTWRDAWE